MPPNVKAITLVAIGDAESKKTDLLFKYTTNASIDVEFQPAFFTDTIQMVVVDRIRYSIRFVDTESDDTYTILRINSYKKADCFVLCYSINNRKSFESIIKKWGIEIRRAGSKAPIVLVGTELEARTSNGLNCITTEEGENLRYLINAAAFVECSTATLVGIDNVFIEAVRSIFA